MKAAIYKNKRLELSDIPIPSIPLKTKGAIIKVLGCGLCGSDIVKFTQSSINDGQVLGHEVVGKITEINSDTDVKVGQKVVLGHHYPCYNCSFCKDKNYSMCKTFKATNIIPGGFSEYIFASEGHLIHTVQQIPENFSDIEISYTEPLACCLRAIKNADIKQNDEVLVIGLGSIGLLMGQALALFGAKATGSDILDERLNLASKSGFNKVIKFKNEDDFINQYKLHNSLGANKVFLVSGNASTINTSIKCVRNGGSIIVFSSVNKNKGFFDNNEIYYRELTIKGAYSASPEEIKEAFEFIKDGKIYLEDYTSEYDIENIEQAIEDTISNKILKAYIKVSNE